jgi:TnpA family transposase
MLRWDSCRNAKYGSEPGVLFYTHLSDQYAPFYTKVINANVRDATHVLDGLLYHESQLRIEEHYTDTAGFTDQIFALCHMLGFEFAPRIADLADKRIYVPGKPADWPNLAPLIGGPLNIKLMEQQFDEVMRLTASIKQGTVTASLILRKLAAYPRQNSLQRALREYGRLERTLFTLKWLRDPALRRRVTGGLNKGEARNALARIRHAVDRRDARPANRIKTPILHPQRSSPVGRGSRTLRSNVDPAGFGFLPQIRRCAPRATSFPMSRWMPDRSDGTRRDWRSCRSK